MLRLIILISFISNTMLIYSLLKFVIGKQKAISRLSRYTNIEEIKEEKRRNARKDYKSGFSFIARGIGSIKLFEGYKKKIHLQLMRSHIMLKPEEVITASMVLLLIFGLLTFAATANFLYTLAASIFGWLVPSFVIKSKIKRRVKYLNDQLGDAIILVSNSLKAGYSFFQAIDVVSKEMNGPISEEFQTVQKEINLGLTTEKALENLVERVSSDNLELVVTAVLIQRQVGGNLAEILDNISSTIRERIMIKGEVKTLTAQGKLSGLIISIMPFGLGLILYLINPDHISVLFKDPLGILILGFSIIMELIGIYFISKVIKIEF